MGSLLSCVVGVVFHPTMHPPQHTTPSGRCCVNFVKRKSTFLLSQKCLLPYYSYVCVHVSIKHDRNGVLLFAVKKCDMPILYIANCSEPRRHFISLQFNNHIRPALSSLFAGRSNVYGTAVQFLVPRSKKGKFIVVTK